ncbi:hypothetical protein [Streptomyces sp. PU_AKi4]|uniref:hypothetical protein n=1 Tax=Streptomyces sp. PU_AKi4 TaxID=2800809 RepID=UPI0035264B7C
MHGSYLRFPRDLPTSGKLVVMSSRVRRFVCAERSCPRRTFAEQHSASPVDPVAGQGSCDRRSSRSVSRLRGGPALECRTPSGSESAGTSC